MKTKLIKIFSLTIAVCVIFASLVSCSEKGDAPKKDRVQSEEPEKNIDKDNASDATADTSENETEKEEAPLKYGDAEVYEKNDKSYAKTDDGKEVELSNENMQKLLEEYAKVQGSGSDKEKDLLNQIQVIIEAPRE